MSNKKENINKKKNDDKKIVIKKEEKKEIKKEKRENRIWNNIKNFFSKIKLGLTKERDTYSFREMMIVMIFSIGIGIIATVSFMLIINKGAGSFILNKELRKFIDAYSSVTRKYYGNIDKDKLINGAINGMMSNVDDPYSSYYDSNNTEAFLEQVEGTYSGIGCEVITTEDNKIKVVNIFEDGPAKEAGLKENDYILSVDDIDYQDKNSSNLAEYIKGSSNKTVKLKIKREDTELELTINRKKVEIPSVREKYFEQNGKKIGYLSISIFSNVTVSQLEKKLKDLESEKIDSLILDVRGNSGGYLSVASDISSLFLKKGKTIYELESSSGSKKKKDNNNKERTYPIAVLINGGSASASEILAAALKESYGGILVGNTTYGKGTVQQTQELSDGSMLKFTVQKWLTPNGTWINEVGIKPDYEVNIDENYFNNPIDDNDNQLQKAIEILGNK